MKTKFVRILLGLGVSFAVFAHSGAASGQESLEVGGKIVRFEAAQTVLRKHCHSCHNENQPRADLSVASLDKIMAGSASGPVVVPGKVEESPLYLVTAHIENPKMPPNKPRISARELKILEDWIRNGLAEDLRMGPDKPVVEPGTNPVSNIPVKRAPEIEIEPWQQPSPVIAMQSSLGSEQVALAGNQQILTWDPKDGAIKLSPMVLQKKSISTLKFHPLREELLVATGVPGESGQIERWDLANNRSLSTVCDESDLIQAFDVSPDGNRIAIGTTEKSVRIYSINDNKRLQSFEKHTDWVTAVAWSPDGLLLATGDRFGAIHIWDMENQVHFATLRNHTAKISSLLWSFSDDVLYSSSLDGSIRAWDMHGQKERYVVEAHGGGVRGICNATGKPFLEIQDQILSYGKENALRVWKQDGTPVSSITLSDEAVSVTVCGETSNPTILLSLLRGELQSLKFNQPDSASLIQLPIARETTSLPKFTPILPQRMAHVKWAVGDEMEIAKHMPPFKVPSAAETRSMEQSVSDLEQSQVALQSIANAKLKLLESLEELEESEARIKQVIEIQQARIRQLEWRTRGQGIEKDK